MKPYLQSDGGFYAVEASGLACLGCEILQSELNEVLPSFPEFTFLRLDMEKDAEEIEALRIDKVPCLMLFYHGKEFARAYGYQPAEILQLWIDAKKEEVLKR